MSRLVALPSNRGQSPETVLLTQRLSGDVCGEAA